MEIYSGQIGYHGCFSEGVCLRRVQPCTVQRVVEPLGAAIGEVGDDIANVQSQCAGLDACGDAPRAVPRPGAVTGLGIAAHHWRLAFGTAHPHIVGRWLDQAVQHGVARQAKDIIDAVGLAPRHHVRATVVAVAADSQPRVRPMAADPAHQAAQMVADFHA